MYGLKQAPKAWYSTFSAFLLSQGFVNSKCDSSLFIYHTTSVITILLVYVDDILLTGNSSTHIQQLVTQMHSTFSMKELGSISYFLGISVQPCAQGYFLSQSKYAQEILTKAGLVECKPCLYPSAVKVTSTVVSSAPFAYPALYRSIVGALQHLTITRPDFAFSVNQACQHMHAPSIGDIATVKRLLRYLKGTLDHGLIFQPSSFLLQAFFNSDWARDCHDRKSTSGYCVFLGDNLISWSAKKQTTVSRFSTEAEYRTLAHTAAELSWLQMLLHELHIYVPTTPILWCDNTSALALATNPVFHAQSKHAEVDCHYVRDRVATKALPLHYVPTSDQLADVFTKALSISRFQFLKGKLLVISSLIRLRGDDKSNNRSAQNHSQQQQVQQVTRAPHLHSNTSSGD